MHKIYLFCLQEVVCKGHKKLHFVNFSSKIKQRVSKIKLILL